MRKENWIGNNKKIFGLGLLVITAILVSLAVPYLVPNDPYLTQLHLAKQPPSLQFPFGTDAFGRCVYSRVLMGARVSIFTSLLLVALTAGIGTLYGLFSGYVGGPIDRLMMMLVDTLLAFPDMILAIAVSGVLGGGMLSVIIALSVTGWTSYARLARSSVIEQKAEVYIQAARLSGCSDLQIMFGHILPSITSKLVVMATLQISTMMMGIAGLSFLGLGIQIPQAEWGSMMSESRSLMQTTPWTILGPGIVMLIVLLIFNAFGESLRKQFE